MCPCPEGDSPTTLRPFEALAAGCVPVFFVEKEVSCIQSRPCIQLLLLLKCTSDLKFCPTRGHHFADLYGQLQVIAYDIPFPSLIDWDSIAFFARSMAEIGQCDYGQRETFKFLDALGGKTLQTPSPVSACFATGIVCLYLESLLVFHTV